MSAPVPDQERFLTTEHLMDDLAGRSIRGGAITAMSQTAKPAVQCGAILLLARLLGSDEFRRALREFRAIEAAFAATG